MSPYEKPLSHWVLSAMLCASGTAWAQGAPTPAPATLVAPGEPLPPRFVLCQREVNAQPNERAAQMRTCLARRLEGERVVQRDCKRQVSGVKGVQARQSALLSCEREALSVTSQNLPVGPAPASRPAPTVTAEAKRTPSPVVPVVAPAPAAPATGEN